uniref:Uncharacterized protein n=1 Tax=Rhizophora mucronata TaxID=61149 RepID=A0A2P2PAF0_RHIMU
MTGTLCRGMHNIFVLYFLACSLRILALVNPRCLVLNLVSLDTM